MARSGERPWRPTHEQIAAAAGRTVPDVAAPGLRILFVGINPGLYSGAVGHHFARPGNRFWTALALSGLTDGVLSPFEERRLLDAGLGITNIVARSISVTPPSGMRALDLPSVRDAMRSALPAARTTPHRGTSCLPEAPRTPVGRACSLTSPSDSRSSRYESMIGR